MTTKVNLKINQGATFKHSFAPWLNEASLPINLTGMTAKMHIRQSHASPAPYVTFSSVVLDAADGSITLSGVTGIIELYLSHADTAAITWLTGVYDLELTDDDDVFRVFEGKVTVSREVTRQ